MREGDILKLTSEVVKRFSQLVRPTGDSNCAQELPGYTHPPPFSANRNFLDFALNPA
jgi:hypothetical protein